MRFENKVAIVTGAGSGIGRAVAQRLAEDGARLAMVDNNADALAETASLVGGADRVIAEVLDISQEGQVAQFVADVLSRYGKIDVLCNNAGISGNDFSDITEADAATWNTILSVNVMGAVYFTKYVARHMRSARQGSIINTASVAGIRSGAGGNAYSASKAAMINLTQTSACDLGASNVRVNAVCPGLIKTSMTAFVFDHARSINKEDKVGTRCELRRYGHPEEVAAVIAFLASDDASYVTGQAIPVDGGTTASLNMPGMKV
jgi:NAD(P)-dependent dehydrogenase (short-subunit alcohol dehydrogenase family)